MRKEADDIALELVMPIMESDKTSKKRKRVQVHTEGLAKFLKNSCINTGYYSFLYLPLDCNTESM